MIVDVDGELDLASSPQLEQALAHAWHDQPGLVVLQLGNLRFLDMAGLRVMLGAQDEAERHGGRLVLANVREPVRRVMKLARVDDLFTILEN